MAPLASHKSVEIRTPPFFSPHIISLVPAAPTKARLRRCSILSLSHAPLPPPHMYHGPIRGPRFSIDPKAPMAPHSKYRLLIFEASVSALSSASAHPRVPGQYGVGC